MGTINGVLPHRWYDCGFPGETVPDVHPGKNGGFYKVKTQPVHGKTFLGLVVRENDTWEMVSQRLKEPLLADTTYSFRISLCHSDTYVSPSRMSSDILSYSTPVILRIWGGDGYCNRKEILAQNNPILNIDWMEYEFTITPKMDYDAFTLEAYYDPMQAFPYNGNLLLDHASDFVPIKKD